MKFLKNLSIKSKLRTPIIFQLILVAVFVYFYFNIQTSIGNKQDSHEFVTRMTDRIKSMSSSIVKFMHQSGKVTFKELETEHKSIASQLKSNGIQIDKATTNKFNGLTAKFKQVDELVTANEGIEKEVFKLADFSIKQSDQYLAQVSQKLVDQNLRRGVSDLERAVIAGAAVNTTANFNIKVLFLQTKQDIAKSAELLTFIDQLLKNVEIDEKRLAGTPFAQLPKNAKTANLKIKELSNTFIENVKKLDSLEKEVTEVYNGILDLFHRIDEQSNTTIFDMITDAFFKLFIIIVALALLTFMISVAMSRWISTPVEAIRERAYDLAHDDVDMTRRIRVTTKDELGDVSALFNKFLERLRQLIVDIKTGSEGVHNSTEDIRSAGDELATRVNQQAAAVTQTATTLEEFSAAIRENTENSAEADMMLADFNAQIQERSALIDNVTNTMNEIYDSSKKIDNIIKVINDISFQTNLLALNAAVEAARAGEAGRGFAVVASEVRNLAQKTAESSKSIQDIVMRNVESTQKGMELVNDTSEFFGEIVGVMGEIVTKISNITNVSREQANGIEQVSQTIAQMDQVSSQNAGLVQQLADTGRGLEQGAAALQGMVAYFKLDEQIGADVPGRTGMETRELKPVDAGTKEFDSSSKKAAKKSEKKSDKKSEKKSGKKSDKKSAKKSDKKRDKKDKKDADDGFFDMDSGNTPTEEDFFGNEGDGFEEF